VGRKPIMPAATRRIAVFICLLLLAIRQPIHTTTKRPPQAETLDTWAGLIGHNRAQRTAMLSCPHNEPGYGHGAAQTSGVNSLIIMSRPASRTLSAATVLCCCPSGRAARRQFFILLVRILRLTRRSRISGAWPRDIDFLILFPLTLCVDWRILKQCPVRHTCRYWGTGEINSSRFFGRREAGSVFLCEFRRAGGPWCFCTKAVSGWKRRFISVELGQKG
jgi:hypothetical protein